MWKWMQEEGSQQLSMEGCCGGTVRTGMDGEGWSRSVYLLLLTPPAHALGRAAWPACSVLCSAFSVPLLAHPGCSTSAAPRPLPPCSDQKVPVRVCLPRLPGLSLHCSPAARLPEELETHLHIQLR